jgi:tripartite-type tricarboxylate transporter receptor subunit TctC
VLELHRGGKLKVLAVTNGTRLLAAPDLPTAVEQGVSDLVSPNFIGVYAPAGTPKIIMEQIAKANLKLLEEPAYQEMLIAGTFEPQPGLGPQPYRAYVESEIARWRPIVQALGIRFD